MKRIHSKAARHNLIKRLIDNSHVHSQAELAKLLEEEGFEVTQTTLSRDLVDLGAAKVRGEKNALVYALPSEGKTEIHKAPTKLEERKDRMLKACQDLLIGAEGSANLCVLQTPPGAAQYLASSIDHTNTPEVMGTIAGDDTVLLICREGYKGQRVADYFIKLSSSR
ncbi:MAG: arginine repressor [Micrococcaceae bacterium]